MNLTMEEMRVLGCLVEKELTTPEYYPLSLNALVNACNQKSNREPISSLAEEDVRRALELLRQDGLSLRSSEGGRVEKHAHNLGPKLGLDRGELALMSLLLLRGPQTVGELRGRVERMHRFADAAEIEAALQYLCDREPSMVAKQERRPGQKEHRYVQRLGASPEIDAAAPPEGPVAPRPEERITRLEERFEEVTAALRSEVELLRNELRDLKRQLE